LSKRSGVRFDTNRYSVPTEHAERTLTLVTDDCEIFLLHAQVLRQTGTTHVLVHVHVHGRRAPISDGPPAQNLRRGAPNFPTSRN